MVVSLRRAMNELFHRPDSQAWSYLEESALVLVAKGTNPAEIALVVQLYRSVKPEERKYLPGNVQKVLEGWGGCLDRARSGNGHQVKRQPITLAQYQQGQANQAAEDRRKEQARAKAKA